MNIDKGGFLMEEIWKDICFEENGTLYDYSDSYQVSNRGNVKSLKGKTERLLKPKDNGCGYLFVDLYKNGKKTNFYVHRLVAFMFLPNKREDRHSIDHIDTNKYNNHVLNLRWANHNENMNNELTKEKISKALTGKTLSEEHKRKLSESKVGKYIGENSPSYGKKLSEETKEKISSSRRGKCKGEENCASIKVSLYREDGSFVQTYESINIASQERHVSAGHITACCKFWEIDCDKNEWNKLYKYRPRKFVGKFSDGTRMIWKYTKESTKQ